MCLYKRTKTRKKAAKDIVVYKFLEPTDTGQWKSPYMRDFLWEVGKEYMASRARYNHPVTIVMDGYFHTYSSMMDAFGGARSYGLSARVFKCIIPKGSYYLEGFDSIGAKGFASKKLRIVEQV